MIPVFMFHALDDVVGSVSSVRPAVFARGLARLHAAGYRAILLDDLAMCLVRQAPLPDKAFVITFDDGYRSVYDHAMPVMARYGMQFTVFLTTGIGAVRADARLPAFNGREMLSWREVREMRAAGHHIGAHTLSHPDLTRLSDEQVRHELVGSKRRIEDALGDAVSSFAYPYGRFDPRVREIAAGEFHMACSDRLAMVTRASDVLAIDRVDAYSLRARWGFRLATTPLLRWYLGTYRQLRRVRRRFARRPATAPALSRKSE